MPVAELLEPSEINLFVASLSRGLLVLPVSGDTKLSPLVHLLGADLNLDASALWPNHGGVERLIEVELGHRDVVLEAPGERGPTCVNCSQSRVAISHGGNYYPNTNQVVDVIELPTTQNHLLINGVVLFGPAIELALYLRTSKFCVYLLDNSVRVIRPGWVALANQGNYFLVNLRV